MASRRKENLEQVEKHLIHRRRMELEAYARTIKGPSS